MSFSIDKIQKAISEEGVDGWLFYDFQGSDAVARRILQIPGNAHMTRRWFYYVPKSGAARKLVHRIEPAALDHLPGDKFLYAGWRELDQNLKKLLSGEKRIAMNYSPANAIPYVSRVDAGTVEMVRATGVEVITAADLIQQFEAVMTEAQLQTHIRATNGLREIVDLTFGYVAKNVTANKSISEYDVQEFMWNEFERRSMISDYRPIVGIGPNSGNPHYAPEKDHSSSVKKDEFLLIDLWAKEKSADAIYGDITWTGFIGKTVPEKYEKIFQVVAGGRDASLKLVQESALKGRQLKGKDVDDASRNFITAQGYGEYFVHRTGHNIGTNVHGNGANMDNFETREERKVLAKTCFSIEPGVYLPEFGVRSEIDVYYAGNEAVVYGQPIQTTVVPILK